jgi:hypothetical protein
MDHERAFMNRRWVSRWAAAVAVVVATQGSVQVVAVETASAAVPGWQIVSAFSKWDSGIYKSAEARCPSGKRVISTGFKIWGGEGDIVLDDLIPSATSVRAGAGEDQDGTSVTWAIEAQAVCANPLPRMEIVSATSRLGTGGSRYITAECTGDRTAVGSGASLANGWGHISLDMLLLGGDQVTASGVDDQDGYSGVWSVTAYAVCATPPPGLTYHGDFSSSSDPKYLRASCPDGAWPLGVEWEVAGDGETYVHGSKVYRGVDPDTMRPFSGAELWANEDDDGYEGGWSAQTGVLCAANV